MRSYCFLAEVTFNISAWANLCFLLHVTTALIWVYFCIQSYHLHSHVIKRLINNVLSIFYEKNGRHHLLKAQKIHSKAFSEHFQESFQKMWLTELIWRFGALWINLTPPTLCISGSCIKIKINLIINVFISL